MEEVTYKCKKCGKTAKTKNGKIPTCCDQPMNKMPLDICTQPSHAEHFRPMDDEEPCDDGRAG